MDDKDAAADITSQVFLKAIINIGSYQHKGFPFSSWLYRIAINEVNQYYRQNKKGRIVNLDENDIKNIMVEAELSFDDNKREKLVEVLASLSQEKVELIEMRFFEKRSFSEIASILKITENNAKVKTYRVLDEMKKIML
jgi:RNA polymerase sigma-70 factor (ECF subfamily)